jgi:hypothetical protein
MKKTTTKKVMKKQEVREPEVKKYSTFELNLTKFELLHLRDLMSVLLPPDGAETLSQSLASAEDRSFIESMLWDKVSNLCKQAKLPLDSEAPDYIVAPLAPPPMGVFQVNQDLQSQGKRLEGGFLPEDKEQTIVEED